MRNGVWFFRNESLYLPAEETERDMKISAYLTLVLLLVGCGRHDPIIHRLLESGDLSPRTRMQSLDSVYDISRLAPECYHNYFYLRAKACYDRGHVSPIDTLLEGDIAYFTRTGELDKAVYLNLCVGRAFRELGKHDRAFACFKEAENMAGGLPDPLPLFCVYYEWGSLAVAEGDNDEAAEQFEKMLSLARENEPLRGNLATGRYALQAAKALLCLGDYDRALYWYGKLTAYTMQIRDSLRASAIYYEMAYSFHKAGQEEKALVYADSTRVYAVSPAGFLHSALLKASVYYSLGQADSLEGQLEQAAGLLPRGGIHDREKYYYLLSQLYRLRGDYRNAYDNFVRYDAITDTTYVRPGARWGKQMHERYARKKAELQAERLRNRNHFYLAMGIVALLVAAAIICSLRRYLREKEEKRIAAEDLASRLNQLLLRSGERLQHSVSRNLESVRHIVRLRNLAQEKGLSLKDLQLVGNGEGQLSWEDLYTTLNMLHDGFKDKLVAAYPGLTDKEVCLCCLFRVGFNTIDVANIFGQSTHTIHKDRGRLRKQLDIPDNEDLALFLEKHIG